MPYKKREVIGVGIGTKEGQVTEIEGLLVGIQEDVGENHSILYELVLENGETKNVWGSTTIDQRIRRSDIGNLCTITFVGMAKSKSGRTFKEIDVEFWEGEPDERLQNWPQYQQRKGVAVLKDGEFEEDESYENPETLPF